MPNVNGTWQPDEIPNNDNIDRKVRPMYIYANYSGYNPYDYHDPSEYNAATDYLGPQAF